MPCVGVYANALVANPVLATATCSLQGTRSLVAVESDRGRKAPLEGAPLGRGRVCIGHGTAGRR
ncbi:hypothetical protein GCM10009657_09850 [Oryzihumus leptocrescens]